MVQHISTFSRGSDGGWIYTFTQEWPFRGMRNQLSYTIPALHNNGTGVGDIQLNYRLQAVGNPDAPVALAPRLTAILPTGSSSESRGFGSAGLQAALPASIHPVPALVFHLNAGVTWLPNAKNPSGREASDHELQPRRQRDLVGQEQDQLPDGMGLAGCGTGECDRWYSA